VLTLLGSGFAVPGAHVGAMRQIIGLSPLCGSQRTLQAEAVKLSGTGEQCG
jgi:hypothetical protein